VYNANTSQGAFIAITSIIFLRETYHPTLLHRKAVQLQKTTGKPHTSIYKQEQGRSSPGYIIRTSISRPLKLLFLSPIVSSISLFCSLAYSYMYILFTTFTSVFMNIYGFNAGEAGLAYLGLGLGFAVGQLTVGYFSDRHMQRQKARYGVMRPEDRLPPMVVGVFLIPVGLVWYGWSAEARTHWIVPIVGTFFVGVGIYYVTLVTQVYLVDAFTIYAASAVSAESSLRSVFGAVLPLAGPPLYARLGMGWGNTLLAFVAAAFAPTSFLLIRYGEKIRTNPRFQPKLA
jgi:MFS family permease